MANNSNNSFNTFAVLRPDYKETYGQKKLKFSKLPNPTLKVKKPKVIMPGTGSGGY